jgi:prepilin-type N-terminal cleavage/methylation domain-containing protein
MKLSLHHNSQAVRALRAFTLPELLVTMAIFLIMTTGIISAHLYGIRMFEFIRPKLTGTDQARTVMSKLFEEVRSASKVRVGIGNISNFTETAISLPQRGNALQIYPGTNDAEYVRYYWDNDQTLKRMTNGSRTAVAMAGSVTNNMVFTCEDYGGNILTNNQTSRVVISVTLNINQLQYPSSTNAAKRVYDYYQVQTRIAKR